MTLTREPICCAPTGDRCGEGVLWHAAEEAVYWTDINRFLVHRFDPRTRCVRSWYFDEPVTAVLLTNIEGTLALSLGSGIILWKPSSDQRSHPVFQLHGWPKVRLNDAGVDPAGSLWAGSMRNNVNADGSEGEAGGTEGVIYRIDGDGAATVWEQHIGVANTFVWNPAADRFYFADTLQNMIWFYDYDRQSGSIRKAGTYLAGFDRGLPDGSAIDENGYVWNCRWGGGCIVRISPAGQVDRIVELPVRNITNCTFGGRDRNVLYVTTAAGGRGATDRLAGSLFEITTDTRGLEERPWMLAPRVTNSLPFSKQ
ncbi:MAG: SMP-30/gluconolactonase/LRE family protein [Acidobacteriaceae bacterium]|nr:SMP-30/gluconolactonase/LRE family protein [Acidobacteriaceae bacterium]